MELILHGIPVLVDDDIADTIISMRWWPTGREKKYLRTYLDKKKISLHRFIMNAKPGDIVDHINCNKLDCRRINLRITDGSGNARNRTIYRSNTTGFKGVTYHKRDKNFQANIRVHNKRIWLGSYKTAEEAYDVYCEASKKYHGEFSRI